MTPESKIIQLVVRTVLCALVAGLLLAGIVCVRSCAKRLHTHPEPGPTSIEQVDPNQSKE